jgi:Rrf2 family protein
VRITKSEEYGLRLVLRLAADGGQLNIRELAHMEAIPETTVAKVISKLRRAGLVCAERGRNGGYSLTLAAQDITIARVVAAFESTVYGPDFCDRMTPGDGGCANESACGLRPVWRGLTAVIGDFLESITVADVIHGKAPQPGSLPMVTGQGV